MPLIAYILIGALAALSTGPVLAGTIAIAMRARHTQEWTAEHIAYVLMREVMKAEGRFLPSDRKGEGKPVDRKWLLDTFAECMQAAQNPDKRLSQPS